MPDNLEHLDLTPRVQSLPGPARIVRISAASWEWLSHSCGPDGTPAPAEQPALDDLVVAGILDDDGIDEQWAASIASALRTPVSIALVCVDGDDAWITTLYVAGRRLVILDRVREASASADRMHLGRASSAVTLAVTDIAWFSATVEALVPQRRAFLTPGREPAGAPPAAVDPAALLDAPAVAEVQALVTSAALPEMPEVRDHSWYALGADGDVLAELCRTDGTVTLEPAFAGAFSTVLKTDLVTAIRQTEKALAGQERVA